LNFKPVQKYLDHYAEPESSELDCPSNSKFERCLVIPAFAESPNFILRLIKAWPEDEQLLVILVINRPEPCSEPYLEQASTCLEQAQHLLSRVEAVSKHLSWRKAVDCSIQFLLVDRCSAHPIPKDQGVGLARKIGCDIALQLHATGQLNSQWVHTTDADAHLPANYFTPKLQDCSAGVYSHRYLKTDPELYQVTQIYDLRNRAYRQQLAAAGSSYGFNPTGSLLALNFTSYAQVRGFPKRAGGEDFYILNKMQKNQGVSEICSDPVELECRLSDRVPFGTGPAVSKLIASTQPEKEEIFYHPKCFEVFAKGLTLLKCTHPAEWFRTKEIPEEFKEALKNLNCESAITHLAPLYEKDELEAARKFQRYQYHLDLWFDAFLSLKTIHFLRDNYFSSISHEEWLKIQSD